MSGFPGVERPRSDARGRSRTALPDHSHRFVPDPSGAPRPLNEHSSFAVALQCCCQRFAPIDGITMDCEISAVHWATLVFGSIRESRRLRHFLWTSDFIGQHIVSIKRRVCRRKPFLTRGGPPARALADRQP
jgi:hypothetical protein